MEASAPMSIQKSRIRPLSAKTSSLESSAAVRVNHSLGIRMGALCVPLLLSSCRFGNHVEQAPVSVDSVSGYYSTSIQGVKLHVDANTLRHADGDLNKVPGGWANILPDPTALIVTNRDKNIAYLVNPNNSNNSFPVYFNSERKLGITSNPAASTLWTDPNCQTQVTLSLDGSYSQSSGLGTSASGLKLSGRIGLNIQMIRTITGDCAATMATLGACYQDAQQCGGSNATENQNWQKSVQTLFNPYIQAGAMTAAEIPSVRGVSYELTYE